MQSPGNGEWSRYCSLGYSQDIATHKSHVCLLRSDSTVHALHALEAFFYYQCHTGQQAAESQNSCISLIIIFKSKPNILTCVSFVRDHINFLWIVIINSLCKLTVSFSLRSLFSVIVTYGNANLCVSAANLFWYCVFPVQM